ncbi:MAG: hypothetical protein WCG19_10935 [Chlorobiaceae bacterium]
MSCKFDTVPVESDTVIILSLEAKLDEYDVLYQKWSWENIYAESFIFASQDVAIMSDDELKEFARSSPMIKPESSVTLKRGEQFTFVNFNFVSSEGE